MRAKKFGLLSSVVIVIFMFAMALSACTNRVASTEFLKLQMTPEGWTVIDVKDKSVTSINIPDTFQNYPVIGIFDEAFKDCDKLEFVHMPNTINYIGKNAFLNCKKLDFVNFSSNVTIIEDGAFYNCISLKDISFPNQLSKIGSNAFYNCISLRNISFPNQLLEIGSNAFYNCKDITSIVIPSSVTSIGEFAFYGCYGIKFVKTDSIDAWCNILFGNEFANPLCYAKELRDENDLVENVIVPDNVTRLDYTFTNCRNLKSVSIPSSVVSISARAFYDCIKLETITFQQNGSLVSVGDDAFYGCDQLANVDIRDIAAWCKIDFDGHEANPLNYLFNTPDSISTNLVIPDGVTSIGSYAFYGCHGITNVTIPSSVKKIGTSAFAECIQIETVSFNEDSRLLEIGASAFKNCLNLNNIVIPETVTRIDDLVFAYCHSLESIKMSNNVTSIGNNAFFNCKNLKIITIPNLVTYIGVSAFASCENLSSVIIPQNVTIVDNHAFDSCPVLTIYVESASKPAEWSDYWDYSNNIKSLKIVWDYKNNNVAEDGYIYFIDENNWRYALKDNVAMIARQFKTQNVSNIPSAVTYNGINYPVVGMAEFAFYDNKGTENMILPDSFTEISDFVFWNSNITTITIPKTVKRIGSFALSDCFGLREINYGGTIEEWNFISKGEKWDEGSGNSYYNYYIVKCSDGTITKQ